MSPPNPHFKALIIGGSVAGLSLAHMFSRAGISYTLLEARDTISPQLGASIVIMPNGARILDQLGVFAGMKDDFVTKMKKTFVRRSDGRLVTSNEWPRLVEEKLGYQCSICERRRFLASLYEQLEDKSRILLEKKVVEIKHEGNEVVARCQDGSEFRGDLVVGADGIHSRTRVEMQRYAEETGPRGLMDRDKSSITAEYNCFFGIADEIPSLVPGNSHVSNDIDHSSLLFVGQGPKTVTNAGTGGLPQWFFFSKMDRKYSGSSIPRFTKAQMERQVEEFGDFKLTEHVTLKEIMKKTKSLSYLPLEEANHEVWTFGRIVCLGDAIHKMTPNLGQGGNQAIESAAVLTNCLLELLNKTPDSKPKLDDLETTLQQYQILRQKRAKKFVDLSGMVTRNEALATLRHTIRYLYTEPLSGEVLAAIQTEMYHTAPYLNFLPLPKHVTENELWKEGVERVKANDIVPRPRL
ncbi:FAD/NAD(P)-binding domain-containing protein [Hyaloscypha variabilis F]|uniref:FAD/NAD(P)-binding domain-containing protein n=1 Tax=Hyaloscypha variabilis (strain UAMH 11265 / GT02V1 / F) TaxID=1149755 RepID=A0A2J6RB42_HYAVF|nr:FAD/NAD(P)-binding domain-containing protein [Hyaloscypha variabilis F]